MHSFVQVCCMQQKCAVLTCGDCCRASLEEAAALKAEVLKLASQEGSSSMDHAADKVELAALRTESRELAELKMLKLASQEAVGSSSPMAHAADEVELAALRAESRELAELKVLAVVGRTYGCSCTSFHFCS
jgi:hypothetical protein